MDRESIIREVLALRRKQVVLEYSREDRTARLHQTAVATAQRKDTLRNLAESARIARKGLTGSAISHRHD